MDSEKLKGAKYEINKSVSLVDDLFKAVSELDDNVSLFEFYAVLKNIGSPATLHLADSFLSGYKDWKRKKR